MVEMSQIKENGRCDFMRIVFLGDSITEGVPGVSYVDTIRSANEDLDIVNRGKGGDTVASLLKRVEKMSDLESFDVFVLFIGINDIFGKLSWQYKFFKALRNQKAAKDHIQFEEKYKELLTSLSTFNKKIIVVPPLLLGEDLSNSWNNQVIELVNIVERLVADNQNSIYLNARTVFIDELHDKEISKYLPLSLIEVVKDVAQLKNSAQVDYRSKERGLYLTLDGVHINSIGAKILSSIILEELNR